MKEGVLQSQGQEDGQKGEVHYKATGEAEDRGAGPEEEPRITFAFDEAEKHG